jgi:hypothetical protein
MYTTRMANIYRPIVPLELVEELRELAAESERSLAAEIRFGLSQHVARRRGIESERGSALTYVLAQHLMLRDGIEPGSETYAQLADALQRARIRGDR